MKNSSKYKRQYFLPPVKCMDWTEKDHVEKAPIWCSVDLRDGNQALVIPMNLEQKVEFFKLLVEIGFKEIEVGFPAASETEYTFLRKLIEEDLIPDDVTIQVLTQAREHIIKKTFEAVKGAKNVIVHVYNSTSLSQREQVFHKSKEEILKAWAEFSGEPQALKLPSAPAQFIHYFEEDNRPQAKLDRNLENGMAVSVGRLRDDILFDYKFVCLSHNTLRGAAGGAVLMAELLAAKGYFG